MDRSAAEPAGPNQHVALVLDGHGCIRAVSGAAQALFGAAAGELVGSRVDDTLSTAVSSSGSVFAKLAASAGAAVQVRPASGGLCLNAQCDPLTTAEGAQWLCRLYSAAAPASDAELLENVVQHSPIDIDGRRHVVASAVDESERERAEGALRAVIEHTPAEVFQLDGEGRVVLINERARRLFGYNTRDAVGRHLSTFVVNGESDYDGPACDIGSLRDNAVVRNGSSECLGIDREGRRFPIRLVLEPVDTPNGQVVLAAITDLTPIIESDRMLARARSMVEEAADVKGGFLATISHEMRTPLNSIIGLSELLEDTPLNPTQSAYVESIRAGGTMLLNLIQDVLDLAKFESGTLQLQEIVFDPRDCLHEALEVVRGAAEAKRLTLRCEIAQDVPGRVVGDPHRLRQVIVNLVGNAIKFTEHGGVGLRLARRSGADGQVALDCDVSDTGIGIPADRIDKLFQAFSQVDTEIQRRFGGSGLGLVICKRLVEAMGGSIGVDSREGRGSTFKFYVQMREAPAIARERRTIPRHQPMPRLEPLKVLLVEDNAINQRVAQMMLARLNQKVVATAANGREALQAVRREIFDVVLMDLLMPVMDGLEASRQIRNTLAPDRQPHIIAMTANAMPGDRERCMEAGMDDYLSKPVHVHELLAVLNRYVRRSAQPAAHSA